MQHSILSKNAGMNPINSNIPYRKKTFIRIDVREIVDCQKLLKQSPSKIFNPSCVSWLAATQELCWVMSLQRDNSKQLLISIFTCREWKSFSIKFDYFLVHSRVYQILNNCAETRGAICCLLLLHKKILHYQNLQNWNIKVRLAL